jgi:DNA-binding FadR family transcriptional regulator
VLFHRTLLRASGNEMFGALDTVVAEVLSGRTHHGLMPATPEAAAVRLHADVAEAVQSGDPAGARRAMQAIIQEAVEAMLGEPAAP